MANTFATDLPAGESPKSRIASCDTTATPTEVAVVAIDPELVRHMGAIRTLLGLVLLVLVIIGVYFAKDVVLPFLVGVILALTLSPLVRGLGKFGIAPTVTALLLMICVSTTLAGGAFIMSGPVSVWVNDAPKLGVELKRKLEKLTSSVIAVQEASNQVDKITTQGTDPGVQKVSIQPPGLLTSAVSNVSSVATSVLVTLVLSFFLLASGDMFYVKLIDAFPKFGDKKRALRIVYGIERSISRYLLSVTLINAGLGMVVGLAMWLVGMPQPLVWAVAAFLLNFLPYLGPAVGIVLSAVVAIVSFDTLSSAILAPAAYFVAVIVEGQFVTPVLLGRRLQLNTVSVFVTVVFWGWLWGIAGALMAVPFLVCLKVICDNVEPLGTLGDFLSAAKPLIPADQGPPDIGD